MDDFDFFDNLFTPVDKNITGQNMFHPMSSSDWMNFQSNLIDGEIDSKVFYQTTIDNQNMQNSNPTFEQDLENGGVIVTDIFGGQHHYASMEEANMFTDVFSGIPTSDFSHTTDNASHDANDTSDEVDNRSLERIKLDKDDKLTRERDFAVDKYRDAMNRKDYDEATKWASFANEKQEALYTLWGTPHYSGYDVKAPGID